MIKPVELTTRAIKDLGKVKDYCKVHFGEEKANGMIDSDFNH